MNPRHAFRRVRDFQSRSFGRSDTSPGGAQGIAAVATPAWTPTTYAATSWICFSLELSPSNDGIAPMPFVTRSTTSAASGLASSRFGPTLPDEPAASSVWQPPQPAEAKTASPAAASPAWRRLRSRPRSSPAPRRSPSRGSQPPRRRAPLPPRGEDDRRPPSCRRRSTTATSTKRPSRLPGKSGLRRGK